MSFQMLSCSSDLKISVIKCPLKYWWWYIRKPDIFKVASGYLGSYFDIVVYPSACLLFHREKTILSCGWMQTSCEIKCLPQYSLQLSFPSLSPFKLLPLFTSVQRCTECSASAEGQGLWHSQLSQSWKSPPACLGDQILWRIPHGDLCLCLSVSEAVYMDFQCCLPRSRSGEMMGYQHQWPDLT